MHDPMTVAFQIKSPIKRKSKLFPKGYRETLITIWHVDPEKDGTDDSCGWFMRSRHGNKQVLDKIVNRFEFDWDRVWKSDSGTVYFNGLFCPNGDPYMSVSAIVLNLFFLAGLEIFDTREKAVKFCQGHLFEILLFAENPFDSLHAGLTRKFEIGCGEPYSERSRKDRIESLAGCIYSWILREIRPWYKHPKWHVWHWKVQWNFIKKLKQHTVNRLEHSGQEAQQTN